MHVYRYPNIPLHIIQRGDNRQACFYTDEDYRLYLDWLREHADKNGCRVHAYENAGQIVYYRKTFQQLAPKAVVGRQCASAHFDLGVVKRGKPCNANFTTSGFAIQDNI